MDYVIKIKYENSLRRLTIQNQLSDEVLKFAQLETRIRELFQLRATQQLVVTYVDEEDDIVTMANDQDVIDALVYQSLNPLRLNVTLNSAGSVGPNQAERERATSAKTDAGLEQLLNVNISSQPASSPLPGVVEDALNTITSKLASAVKNAAASISSEPPTRPKQPSHQGVRTEDEIVDDVVHHGVSCDICEMTPIVGLRWKSIKKFDYDLCQKCFEKHGNQNDYSRIDQPLLRPRNLHGPHKLMRRVPTMAQSNVYMGRPFSMRGPQCGRHWGPIGGFAGKLDAQFVRDITMFDGSEIAPGTPFTKIWHLRNNGTIPWPAHTSLVLVGGDGMSQASPVPLDIPEQGLAPEGEIEVSVDLVAPEKPGRYVSHWRLATPAGPKFGHRIWVLLQVVPIETLDKPAVPKENMTESEIQTKVEEKEVQKDLSGAESGDVNVAAGVVAEVAPVTKGPSTAAVDEKSGLEEPEAEESEPDFICDFLSISEPEASAPEDVVHSESPTAYPVLEVTDDAEPVTYPAIEPVSPPKKQDISVSEASEVVKQDVVEGTEDSSTMRALMAKLQTMGFTDSKLNLELLERNSLDLRKTLDDLCAAEEWDPILEELEEMGFYDANMNRRLMFKNNGSVKLVVKDLVQMEKDPKGKGK